MDKILILDFGSQYTQLIARRVREAHVYCEIKPWNTPQAGLIDSTTRGVIISGGPLSIYAPDAPQLPEVVFTSHLPILGICYGMQALTYQLGGEVAPAQSREYGLATLQVLEPNPLLPPGELTVWMSHGDRITRQPPGWQVLARSANSPIAAMGDLANQRYGLQFHPEVRHTPQGSLILRRFVIDICGCKGDWTSASIIEQSIANMRVQVGQGWCFPPSAGA